MRAFFVVGAVAALPLALLATRSAEPSTSPEPSRRSPSYELTEAEAIAEFERLNAQLMAAYRERNIALAEDVFTSDSPMLPRVRKEVDDLIDASVHSRTTFEPQETIVVALASTRILLERTEILHPRFVGEDGTDAGANTGPERRVVRWELHQEEGTWLLHDGTVVERDTLPQGGRS